MRSIIDWMEQEDAHFFTEIEFWYFSNVRYIFLYVATNVPDFGIAAIGTHILNEENQENYLGYIRHTNSKQLSPSDGFENIQI